MLQDCLPFAAFGHATQSFLAIMSLRACEAVSYFRDEIAYPSLRLGTLRSRTSLLCHCELAKQSPITGFAITDAARLLTLRCTWVRYAVVPRNYVTASLRSSLLLQDEIAYPSLRLSTLRSRTSLLCHCELAKQSPITGFAITDAARLLRTSQ